MGNLCTVRVESELSTVSSPRLRVPAVLSLGSSTSSDGCGLRESRRIYAMYSTVLNSSNYLLTFKQVQFGRGRIRRFLLRRGSETVTIAIPRYRPNQF